MPKSPQTPFDLTAAKLKHHDTYDDLARWIVDEIHNAQDARSDTEAVLDYWHRIYEQDRTRLAEHDPTPNGADLTTPLGTQYVDALHARSMQTLFVEPIWTVEGWGNSVRKAPFVEEFHQWTAEDERVQNYVDRAVQNAWVDGVGILEVYEENDYAPVRRTIWAALETMVDEMGQPRAVFDENNEPIYQRDEQGDYVEVPPEVAQSGQVAAAQLEIDDYQLIRKGPGYAVIDYNDFFVLPSHARERKDVWGYARKFTRRVPYLQQKAKDGIYDKKAIEAIGEENEREQELEDERLDRIVTRQQGPTAEKELWEISLFMDLDGKGLRWWIATVSEKYQKLLRLKYDDLGNQAGTGRYLRFVPFPRKNSLDGLSVIGHKLITLIEEHTAVRNIRADLAALRASAPIKVQQGALYNPDENPIGVGATIWVRDMNEVQPMDMPDLSSPLNHWESSIMDAAERTMGVNDISSGLSPQTARTATERQLVAGYSEVRMNLITKRLQETMEELAQIRNVIWKRTLAAEGPMSVPKSVMVGLEARGFSVDEVIPGGMVSAEILDGKYRFKPRGSVETADLGRLRTDFVQLMQMLPALMQINPAIGQSWSTPDAARALNEQLIKLFRFPDRQALLGATTPMGQQMMPGRQPMGQPQQGIPRPPQGIPEPRATSPAPQGTQAPGAPPIAGGPGGIS